MSVGIASILSLKVFCLHRTAKAFGNLNSIIVLKHTMFARIAKISSFTLNLGDAFYAYMLSNLCLRIKTNELGRNPKIQQRYKRKNAEFKKLINAITFHVLHTTVMQIYVAVY